MIDTINGLLEKHGLARSAHRWVLPSNRFRLGPIDFGGILIDVTPAENYVPNCVNGFAVVLYDDGRMKIGAWDDGSYPSLVALTPPMVGFLADLVETFPNAPE